MNEKFGVVVAGAVLSVGYDLFDAQKNSEVTFEVRNSDSGTLRHKGSEELEIGDQIPIVVANEVERVLRKDQRFEQKVYGFVVQDRQLGIFIERFPEKEIFRKNDEDLRSSSLSETSSQENDENIESGTGKTNS